MALAGDHGGAGVGHVATVGEQGVRRQLGMVLVDRRGLAGQCRFDGAQLAAVKDAQVGRYLVAGGQPDHVAGHQVHGIHALALSAAHHRDFGGDRAGQRRQRRLGLAFLQVADHRIDDDHAKDHRAVHPFAEQGGDDAGTDEHQHQRFPQLCEEALPGAATGLLAGAVGAVACQARRSLGVAQAVVGLHAVMVQSLGRGQCVPVAPGCGIADGFCGVHAAIIRRRGDGLVDAGQMDAHAQAAAAGRCRRGSFCRHGARRYGDDGQAQAAARRALGDGIRRVGAGATAKALLHDLAFGRGNAPAVIR
jgi:hypothetical protein